MDEKKVFGAVIVCGDEKKRKGERGDGRVVLFYLRPVSCICACAV
jgi:hypothetical protein